MKPKRQPPAKFVQLVEVKLDDRTVVLALDADGGIHLWDTSLTGYRFVQVPVRRLR